MKLEKYKVNFNSEESIEFLMDRFVNSPEDIQYALEEFKTTKKYLSNNWDEDDIWELFEQRGMSFIPTSNLAVIYTFELPELNND